MPANSRRVSMTPSLFCARISNGQTFLMQIVSLSRLGCKVRESGARKLKRCLAAPDAYKVFPRLSPLRAMLHSIFHTIFHTTSIPSSMKTREGWLRNSRPSSRSSLVPTREGGFRAKTRLKRFGRNVVVSYPIRLTAVCEGRIDSSRLYSAVSRTSRRHPEACPKPKSSHHSRAERGGRSVARREAETRLLVPSPDRPWRLRRQSNDHRLSLKGPTGPATTIKPSQSPSRMCPRPNCGNDRARTGAQRPLRRIREGGPDLRAGPRPRLTNEVISEHREPHGVAVVFSHSSQAHPRQGFLNEHGSLRTRSLPAFLRPVFESRPRFHLLATQETGLEPSPAHPQPPGELRRTAGGPTQRQQPAPRNHNTSEHTGAAFSGRPRRRKGIGPADALTIGLRCSKA